MAKLPERTPSRRPRRFDAAWSGDHAAVEAVELAPPPTLALGLACAAIVSAAFATTFTVAAVSAVFTLAAGLAALAGGAHLRESAGWLAYTTGALAAGLSAASALLIHLDGSDARLPLVGAAFVASLANLRWWLDALSEAPVDALERSVRRAVPLGMRGNARAEEDKIRVGEERVVVGGDVVSADGEIVRGTALVLLHPASHTPTRRSRGDCLLAGARIVEGELTVRANHVGPDRALLRPIHFADGTAADAAVVTARIARLLSFTGVVAAVGVILGVVIAPSEGGLAARLAASAAVLIAIPALSLRRASSMPHAAAGLAGARRGIIFANARALDRAGRVNTTLLCTHGTVTEGTPEVVESHGIGGDPEAALLLAAACAHESTHPISRAIVQHVGVASHELPTVRRITEVPGRGVRGSGPNGEMILVGSRQLLLDEGTSVAASEGEVQRAEGRALSVVFIAIDGRAKAWIALRDDVRAGARAAVQRLIDLDIDTQLLSGDHRGTIEALAKLVDVEQVKAELPPAERGAEVRRLRDAGAKVAVVGRRGTDEEALEGADVPILLEAAGSAQAQRGIALTTDDLQDASAALWIARAASRDAMRASVTCISVGAGLVVLGAFGLLAPGIIAILALILDLYALPTPARVLKRIDLRLPERG
jgi:P-type E1-E2 ATPase